MVGGGIQPKKAMVEDRLVEKGSGAEGRQDGRLRLVAGVRPRI